MREMLDSMLEVISRILLFCPNLVVMAWTILENKKG